nr:MTH1187 family thiamine-binding protein [Desulfobacterales bacterium]
MAIVETSIVPIGTSTTSLSSYVAGCIKVLEASGLSYQLHGMGTIIEGDLDRILDVILKMHEVPFDEGARRVITSIKIDDRRDRKGSATDKVRSVTERL